MMRDCEKCGAGLEAADLFCGECGARVSTEMDGSQPGDSQGGGSVATETSSRVVGDGADDDKAGLGSGASDQNGTNQADAAPSTVSSRDAAGRLKMAGCVFVSAFVAVYIVISFVTEETIFEYGAVLDLFFWINDGKFDGLFTSYLFVDPLFVGLIFLFCVAISKLFFSTNIHILGNSFFSLLAFYIIKSVSNFIEYSILEDQSYNYFPDDYWYSWQFPVLVAVLTSVIWLVADHYNLVGRRGRRP